MPHLIDWSFTGLLSSPYQPPKNSKIAIQGFIKGHPFRSNGWGIISTPLQSFDRDQRILVSYSGTEYILGKPDEDYLVEYGLTESDMLDGIEDYFMSNDDV